MAVYRYIFLSLRDEAVIEEIDLYGVNAQRVLSGPGQFTGSFQFDQTGKNNADLVAATTPGRTWLVMERDGVPVWWGIVWSRTYQSQAKACQLFAWGFEAYPQKQRLDSDFSRTNVPNTQIFTDLWSTMQLGAGRNLNIDVTSTGAGPLKSVNVLATDRSNFGDIMDQLSNAVDGFDWTVDLNKLADGTYHKSLRTGYPTMGSTASANMVVFEYPGNITNYYLSESMADAGTHVTVLGSGEGSAMVTATAVQTDMVTYGWPRWDVDVSFKDVTDPAQVAVLAQQQAIVRKPPMPSFTVEVRADIDPIFGTYNVGDTCQLVITDPRNPSVDGSLAGLSIISTVIGFELTPTASDSAESVKIMLPGDVVIG